ncbi:MAG: hypothetical protein AAGI53_07610 [Planctomycetota bacterium]
MTERPDDRPAQQVTPYVDPHEDRLGCLGWFCAVVGITPARVKGKRQLREEASREMPQVIRTGGTEGEAPDSGDRAPES